MRGRHVAFVLLTFVFTACTGQANDEEIPTPISGGTLRVGVVDTEACRLTLCGGVWDPQVSYFNLQYELGRCCLLRSLLSYNGRPTGDGGGVLRPDLAEALPTIAPDGLTWTFRLRAGMRYAPPLEDTPIVAQDVVRSIERALSRRPPELGHWWGPFLDTYVGDFLNLQHIIQGADDYVAGTADRISGLETPDDRTLVIRLDTPSGTLGNLLALPDLAPIPPAPAGDVEHGVADAFPYGPSLVASGPYMVEGADGLDVSLPVAERPNPTGDAAGTLTLVRNPSWSPAQDPLRRAAADRIVLVRVPDPERGVALVSSGDLDLLWDWRSTDQGVADARELPGTELHSVSRDVLRFLRLNVAAPPLDDVHVRRAVAFVVDRAAVNEVFRREAELDVELALHVGLDSQEGNLLANFDPFGVADGPDLDAARREMALSRYDTDGDGRCDDPACDGFAFLVLRPFDDFTRGQAGAAESVARDVAAIGLHPEIEMVDDPSLIYDHPENHVAMAIDAWLKDGTTSATWFGPLFGSGELGATGAETNFLLVGASPKQLEGWGYPTRSVPSVDDRLRTCLGLAFQAQTQCWAELDRYLTQEVVPMVPLGVEVQTTVVSDRVAEFSFDQSASVPIAALDQVVVPPGEVSVPTPAPDGAVPDIPAGTYAMTVSERDVVRAIPDASPKDIGYNTGSQTLVVDGRGGWYVVQWTPKPDTPFVASGTYASDGPSQVVFRAEASAENAFDGSLLAWELIGDDLRLTMQDCRTDDEFFCQFLGVFWTAHPWRRVG